MEVHVYILTAAQTVEVCREAINGHISLEELEARLNEPYSGVKPETENEEARKCRLDWKETVLRLVKGHNVLVSFYPTGYDGQPPAPEGANRHDEDQVYDELERLGYTVLGGGFGSRNGVIDIR